MSKSWATLGLVLMLSTHATAGQQYIIPYSIQEYVAQPGYIGIRNNHPSCWTVVIHWTAAPSVIRRYDLKGYSETTIKHLAGAVRYQVLGLEPCGTKKPVRKDTTQ